MEGRNGVSFLNRDALTLRYTRLGKGVCRPGVAFDQVIQYAAAQMGREDDNA